MMKALRRRHKDHTVRAGPWTIAITPAMWLAAGSASAPAVPASTATTSVSAIGPDGVHLRAWVRKARPGAATLIVVNGGPGNSHLASPPAGELASRFRVVFYDQRGTGRSTTPPDDAFDLPHQVGDLEALRRRHGAPQVDLLGHSFGGLIAAAYAARYPQHMSRLVLAGAVPADASAIPQVDVLGRRLAALMASGIIPTPLPQVVGNDCSAQTMAIAVASLANPRSHRPTYLPPGTCNEATRIQTRAQITAAICEAVRTRLRRYRGRVLLVFGQQDPRRRVFQPLDRAEVSAAHVQVTVLSHSGHDTCIEDRRLFPMIRYILVRP